MVLRGISPRLPASERRRGATLIFVMGILALMSIFAIAFASLVRLERQASANYMLSVRADLAAKAGVEFAVGALRDMMRPIRKVGGTFEKRYCETAFSNPFGTWHYHGYVRGSTDTLKNSTGHGVPLPLAAALPRPTSLPSALGTPGHRPLSFELTPPGARQASQLALERFSGILGGTHLAGGDVHALKVLDAQGMINVNFPIGAAGSPEENRFKDMLDVLGAEIKTEYTTLKTNVPTVDPKRITLAEVMPDLAVNPLAKAVQAAKLIEARRKLPGTIVRSKEQLAMLTDSGGIRIWTDGQFKAIADYLTCWSDGDQVVAGASTKLKAPADGAEFDEDLVTRYPVNINTAPYPVLVAVLANTKAKRWKCVVDGTASAPGFGSSIKPMAPYLTGGSSLVAVTCDLAGAKAFAQKILEWRSDTGEGKGRFRGWRDVYRCFAEVVASTPDKKDAMIAALVATNPHALSLGWNPDRTLFYWDEDGEVPIDADKASATTNVELCFSTNVYQIESLGRIYSRDGAGFRIDAESTRHALVRIGAFASVRGQEELKSLDKPASGRVTWPQPLTQPPESSTFKPSKTGWVQLAPVRGDFGGPVDLPDTTTDLRVGASPGPNDGKVLSDGYFQQRSYNQSSEPHAPPAELEPDITGKFQANEKTDKGLVSLWWKVPYEITEGTNESIIHYLRRFQDGEFYQPSADVYETDKATDPTRPEAVGCCTRLERFGKKFFASRFFWGKVKDPKKGKKGLVDGAAPPLKPANGWSGHFYAFNTPSEADIETWRPGTWHHIVLSWDVMTNNYPKVYIDGREFEGSRASETHTEYTYDKSSTVHKSGEGGGIHWDANQTDRYEWEFIRWEGRPIPHPVFGWVHHPGYGTVTFETKMGLESRVMLASMKVPTDKVPHLRIGGYDATESKLPDRELWKLDMKLTTGKNAVRWCNGTFADVHFRSSTTAPTFASESRFSVFFSAATLELKKAGTTDPLAKIDPVAYDLAETLRDKLACYVTWFAMFAPETDEDELTVATQPLPKTPKALDGSTGTGKVDMNRWGGGVPATSLTKISIEGAFSNAPNSPRKKGIQVPFALAGVQIQYLLPAPLYLEQSSHINE